MTCRLPWHVAIYSVRMSFYHESPQKREWPRVEEGEWTKFEPNITLCKQVVTQKESAKWNLLCQCSKGVLKSLCPEICQRVFVLETSHIMSVPKRDGHQNNGVNLGSFHAFCGGGGERGHQIHGVKCVCMQSTPFDIGGVLYKRKSVEWSAKGMRWGAQNFVKNSYAEWFGKHTMNKICRIL